jgi:competence protein CoiA
MRGGTMLWANRDNEKIKASPCTTAYCPICNEKVIAKCGTIKTWHWSHLSLKDCDTWSEGETEWHLKWKNEFPKEQQEIVIGKHRADVKTLKGTIIEIQNSPITPEEVSEREIYYNNMIWLLNSETLGKNILLKNKTSFFSFRWKNPPKSFWSCDKCIYIDFSHKISTMEKEMKNILEQSVIICNDIKIKTGKTPQQIYNEEYKSVYPFGYNEEVRKIFRKWEELRESYNDMESRKKQINGEIFLIKKLYPNIPCGGWGIFLTKEEFLKQFK